MTTQQHVDILLDLPGPTPAGAGALAAGRRARQRPSVARWAAVLAGLVILALLMGFQQVVRESVRQGEALRAAAASRSDAEWRCRSLQRAALRASCLAQLEAPPPAHAEGLPPPNTASLATARPGS